MEMEEKHINTLCHWCKDKRYIFRCSMCRPFHQLNYCEDCVRLWHTRGYSTNHLIELKEYKIFMQLSKWNNIWININQILTNNEKEEEQIQEILSLVMKEQDKYKMTPFDILSLERILSYLSKENRMTNDSIRMYWYINFMHYLRAVYQYHECVTCIRAMSCKEATCINMQLHGKHVSTDKPCTSLPCYLIYQGSQHIKRCKDISRCIFCIHVKFRSIKILILGLQVFLKRCQQTAKTKQFSMEQMNKLQQQMNIYQIKMQLKYKELDKMQLHLKKIQLMPIPDVPLQCHLPCMNIRNENESLEMDSMKKVENIVENYEITSEIHTMANDEESDVEIQQLTKKRPVIEDDSDDSDNGFEILELEISQANTNSIAMDDTNTETYTQYKTKKRPVIEDNSDEEIGFADHQNSQTNTEAMATKCSTTEAYSNAEASANTELAIKQESDSNTDIVSKATTDTNTRIDIKTEPVSNVQEAPNAISDVTMETVTNTAIHTNASVEPSVYEGENYISKLLLSIPGNKKSLEEFANAVEMGRLIVDAGYFAKDKDSDCDDQLQSVREHLTHQLASTTCTDSMCITIERHFCHIAYCNEGQENDRKCAYCIQINIWELTRIINVHEQKAKEILSNKQNILKRMTDVLNSSQTTMIEELEQELNHLQTKSRKVDEEIIIGNKKLEEARQQLTFLHPSVILHANTTQTQVK